MYGMSQFYKVKSSLARTTVPPNTGQSLNVVSMAGQCRIHWANIETPLGEWHVFAGVLPLSI